MVGNRLASMHQPRMSARTLQESRDQLDFNEPVNDRVRKVKTIAHADSVYFISARGRGRDRFLPWLTTPDLAALTGLATRENLDHQS